MNVRAQLTLQSVWLLLPVTIAFAALGYATFCVAKLGAASASGALATTLSFVTALQFFGSPMGWVEIAAYGTQSPFRPGSHVAATYAILGLLWTFAFRKRTHSSISSVWQTYLLAFIATWVGVSVLGGFTALVMFAAGVH